MTTLKQLGEFGLIERLTAQLNAREDLSTFGLGDDCATIKVGGKTLLLSTDCLVSGRHFDLSFASAESVGYRALAVNISDIAAMGGNPTFALVSLQAPPETSAEQIELIYSGLISCGEQFGVKIVGGNVTASAYLVIGVTIVGEVSNDEPIRRSGANVGDDIWISGRLGGAAAALRAVRGEIHSVDSQLKELWLRRLTHPLPKVELGRILQSEKLANSMIDVSDGLIQDLGHVTAASNVSADIDIDKIPLERGVSEFNSGDDFELLFTASPHYASRVAALQSTCGELTKIGTIVPAGEGNLATIAAKLRGGFDHFL